jgi:hypothetical protein
VGDERPARGHGDCCDEPSAGGGGLVLHER